jgi:hypothetical protein
MQQEESMATELAPAAENVSGRAGPSWTALLAFGLATRVIVVIVGCLIARPENLVSSREAFSAHNDRMNPRHRAALTEGHRPLIQSWYRWDAMWYADIAERGYSYHPGQQSSVAFMPMLPLLMRASEHLRLDRYWAGVLIPNLAFVAGLALFGRSVFRVTQNAATCWRACILLAAFPTSFFFSAPYQESLVLSLSAASLLAWLNYRPGRSALALAVASAARLTALSMSVGLVLEWVADLVKRRRARHSAWFVAIAGTAGLLLFFGYLSWQFRDPALHLKAHAAWDRKSPSAVNLAASLWSVVSSSATLGHRSVFFALSLGTLLVWLCHKPLLAVAARPLGTTVLDWPGQFLRRFPTLPPVRFRGPLIAGLAIVAAAVGLGVLRATGFSVSPRPLLRAVAEGRDFLAALLFLGLGAHALLKGRPLWGCLVLIPVLQALATGNTGSMTRVVLSAYPAFLDAAELTSGRFSFTFAVACCLVGQFAMLSSYVNWTFIA